jgi:hypothetical protein
MRAYSKGGEMRNQRRGRLFILFSVLFLFDRLIGSDRITLSSVYEIKGPPGKAFGFLLDVTVDEKGQLFILDKLKDEIYRFDRDGRFISTVDVPLAGLKEGYWSPQGIFASGNRLYILNGLSIVILDLAGGSIKEIPANSVVGDAFYVYNEEIVIIGTKQGSMDTFRVLDEDGKEIGSFGGPSAIPYRILTRIYQEKFRNSLFKAIRTYYSAPHDELYVIDPTKDYRIQIFRDRELFKTLARDAYDGPVSNNPIPLYYPSVIRKDDIVLVFRPRTSVWPLNYCVDIFKDYVYQSTQDLDIKGPAIAADQEGNVYVVGESIDATISIIKMKMNIS